MTITDWDLLALLIEYPDEIFLETLGASKTSAHVERVISAAVRRFEKAIATLSLDDLQELYVATFDFQPGCALEIGHHLYGEGDERVTFVAGLRDAMQRRNVTLGGDLPDHLGAVLRLVGREEADRAIALRAKITPAVQRVREALASRKSPYVHVFEAICAALTSLVAAG
jgi:nitrate reductase molybdenum cofactor assembly chaperone NarJ/NarW